jgi:hypothetical protein
VENASFPLAWCKRAEIEAFPFATDGSGTFLAADCRQADQVWWVTSEDPPVNAWPDGTMSGLLTATIDAYRGTSSEYRLEHADDRMGWIASWQPEF